MATYLDLVTKLLAFSEKVPFAQASDAQLNLALRDVNDAVRYVYNHGDLSFKTAVKRHFTYTVQTDADAPDKGTPLPADLMGFHQTGGVFFEDFPSREPLIYLPYHKIVYRVEGPEAGVGLPTHYGYGGPADPDSAANQRELLIWKTPSTPTLDLKLVYQRRAPDDVEEIGDADVEIPRISETWHIPVVLAMAKAFRKADKGADEEFLMATLKTAIRQMEVQEPHGRERARRRTPHPAWVR